MKCKNCSQPVELVLDKSDSNFGEPIHRNGYFACGMPQLPKIAEFEDDDLATLTRALEIRMFHEAHIDG